MFKRLMIIFAFLSLLFSGISASAGMAKADQVKNDEGLCLASPEKTTIVNHDAEYVTESRWRRDIPAVDEVSHLEYRFFRDIPAVDEVSHTESMLKRWVPGKDAVTHNEWRMVTTNPGSDAVTHTEYQFKRTNKGHEETFTTEFKYEKTVPAVIGVKECQYKKWVKDYTTEYQYAKYTQTKTRSSEVWANFSPDKKHEVYVGPPSWPTDTDGKWEIHSDIPGGHAGDNGVYQKGTGNSSWFYRHNAGGWSDYGAWTKWNPLSHMSWETFNQPSIGNPAFHADGSDNGTDWYRQWQVRNTGETRQVENGGHWEYKWFTEDPGNGWIKTNECRWKVEPKDAYTVQYKDGAWTTDTPGDPWVKTGTRTVSNNDYVAPFTEYKTGGDPSTNMGDAKWFEDSSFGGWDQFNTKTVTDKDVVPPFSEWATKDGRTTDVTKAAYFTEAEIATFSRAWSKYGDPKVVEDSAAIPGYFEYATDEGPSLNESDADTFTDAEIATFDRGWVKFGDPVKVVDSKAIPGWREYKTADSSSKDILDAVWFLDNAFEGWTVLDSKKVITTEHVDGYTEYYVAGGEPTRELVESNWTTDEPEGWIFVDTREALTKKAWTDKTVTPAKYKTCSDTTLAFTGAGDMTWPIAGFGLLLVLAGAALVKLVKSRKEA